MGDGTRANPYTREDVLKLIKENGGTAQGLDLSYMWFQHLHELDLGGIILIFAHLKGVSLWDTNLEGASLWHAEFSSDTGLEDTYWGNFILGEENSCDFDMAEDTYRQLKQWYTNHGMYDIAGKFFFREMTARRKAMKWWPNPLNRAFSKLLSILCGYGEKPERVVRSALATILSLALAYRLWGSFNTSSLWDMLYYSAVSFISLGYGNWAPQPTRWAKGIGVLEAFVGFFMMTLFLVTFTRKMTR